MGSSANSSTTGFLNDQLSKKTSIFGLRLWVLLGIGVGAFIVLILFCLSLWLTSKKKSKRLNDRMLPPSVIPVVSKEIQEVKVDPLGSSNGTRDREDLNLSDRETEKALGYAKIGKHNSDGEKAGANSDVETASDVTVHINLNAKPIERQGLLRDKGSLLSDKCSSVSGETARSMESPASSVPEVSHLGWGHWYILRDLEIATNGFADENVIGEGGYGIVYRGLLANGIAVAVKNLLNNRGQAEREFRVEVEAIGRVRHKNLVRLLGYCAEGAHRMLVYEYVDNGNLEQWLHGEVGSVSPLTWDIRMKIILGTAKGLAYLHEGLEPKVVHRDIKSSNILLDRHWNAKVSDFGLAKLIGSERSYVTTRVMGTFGYVAPEYASTGMLNERSDVYSFGVLIMEIITGRSPVDYAKPAGEVNLVEWLKMMVSNRRSEEVVDPLMEAKPPSRLLRRALLVALKCVDPDASKRPKMGHVIHMLEADEFPFTQDRRMARARRESLATERQSIKAGDNPGSGDNEKGSPSQRFSNSRRRL
eukprot:TRINITY_DN6674_c0_g3_i1.p1 TRINITY_DN6674_c0_g3~~TRINITY_DN6674_c0_g3_i1.p1  ORF type:complete len:532 (-),score=87.73 TRINITY_DN6674_c0_g3_i1:205-1800(-)